MAYQNIKNLREFIHCYAGVLLCIFLNGPISLGLIVNVHHSLDELSQYSIWQQGRDAYVYIRAVTHLKCNLK